MTLQELYDKVMASEALKNSFAEAAQDKGKLEAWLKEQGSDATVEQVGEFLKNKQSSGEVSDEELENVAGGKISDQITWSILTAGVMCATAAAVSEISGHSASECMDNVK